MEKFINCDLEEIDKFSNISKDWWDTKGPMYSLHKINPLRIEFITQHVDISNKKILDIGCGGGILSESFAKLGANVTGIDLAEKSISIAKQHAKQENLNINYLFQNIENIDEKYHGSFDVITCMEVLEHVPNPKKIIEKCSNLISDNGSIFLSTLNRNLKSFIFSIIGAEYILKILPIGTHSYNNFIRPDEMEKWCFDNDLFLKNSSSITYNPFIKKFKIKKGIDVNYILHFKKN